MAVSVRKIRVVFRGEINYETEIHMCVCVRVHSRKALPALSVCRSSDVGALAMSSHHFIISLHTHIQTKLASLLCVCVCWPAWWQYQTETERISANITDFLWP